ncbi:Uncharacterized protein dnm_078660 [Desulfonema magnum]|uniref:Uncharacterized protein n=1 Tax=Desulfonema magnum TaxID=45655 RepID=A0A975BUX1_9BACT|nr:Uncharacterized protein dnm_078660 [Desulfonema magnum]
MPEKMSKITYGELGDFLTSIGFEEIKKTGILFSAIMSLIR